MSEGCACPNCRLSRAHEEAQAAHDMLYERASERDMGLFFLLAEVKAIASSPLALGVRRRLREAARKAAPHG